MAISVGLTPALDLDARRDGIRPAIALVGVLEPDANLGLPPPDDRDRDSDRRLLPEPGAEVGMQSLVRADRADDSVRVGGDRQAVDALVPRVRRREDGTPGRRGVTQRLRRPSAYEQGQADEGEEGSSSHVLYRLQEPADQRMGSLEKVKSRLDRDPAVAERQASVVPIAVNDVIPLVR